MQTAAIGSLLIERRFRRRIQQSLDDALRFERALGEISRDLAIDDASLDSSIRRALERLAQQFDVERVFIHELIDSGSHMRLALEWVEPGEPPTRREIAASELPMAAWLLQGGRLVRFDGAVEHEEWRAFQSGGVRAFMVCPLRAAGLTVGTLTVSSRLRVPRWTVDHEERLRAFAEVFANVLVHRRSRLILHESEAFNRAVLAAHAGDVAVIDHSGVVVAANVAWQRAATGQAGPLVGAWPGRSYEATSDRRAGSTNASAAIIAVLRSVLAGSQPEAAADVEWEGPDGRAWSEVRVRALDRPEGGAVLSHTDITARKRAELQVQRHLHELAHLNMVAAVGELAASVAHELNQPSTAVLSNAQALHRMMTARVGDPQMMIEIVEDIIAQEKRAGDVIERTRRLLRKETVDWAPVDVNAVVRDIVRMFSGEGTLPGVPIVMDLTADLPLVRGDRVQLQQVFLNLMQNAAHAARAATWRPHAGIRVSTSFDTDRLRVVVRDHGAGIAPEMLGRVFEPFFTTKGEGLGLGLSISRSIVELHGGSIAAHNPPDGGAEFSIALPFDKVST